MRCKLNWKLRGTKSSRLYFQLQVSTLRTEGIGCGLLPTVMACEGHKNMSCSSQKYISNMARADLLPTPQSRDWRSGNNPDGDAHKRKVEQGWTIELPTMAIMDLLPTPTVNDSKNASLPPSQEHRSDSIVKRILDNNPQTGTTSQLNPLFVAEMMGFPLNHCDSAYEKIAWDLYMKKKLTKSFQKRILSGATNP